VIARFGADGAALDLAPKEYEFIYLTLSYVLHGVRLADHDFINILGMSRQAAEDLYSQMQGLEASARRRGDHWLPALPVDD
jgi:hypothetical protein